MNKWEKVISFLEEQGGILKKEQFKTIGVDYRKVLEWVEEGKLVRVKNGYYTDRMDRFSEEALVARLFSDGYLCMESALYVYGYLTERPEVWHIAIDKNTSKSRFQMESPKVHPYYTEPESLKVGATTVKFEDVTFGIYEKERVICDCLKYEDKMVRACFKQAIQAYIKDEEKDISKLLEYARERRVLKKVQNLIGVWL